MDDFIENAKNWATMPVPGAQAPDEQRKMFDAMSTDQLAETWRALQLVGLRDQTEGTWSATLYFDALPHNEPERALDLVLAVLRSEQDKLILMQLNGKLMTSLVHAHAGTLIDRLEREAKINAKLRWLLGGASWWAPDEELKARLSAVADIESWRADDDTRDAMEMPVDFASLSPAELAKVWIEQSSKPEKDQRRTWSDLRDHEREWSEHDPDRMLDMILEILKVESNPHMLGYLAAGPLEDTISLKSIDRVEREAAANPAFRHLLGGVWYFSAPEELKARLDAIIKDERW